MQLLVSEAERGSRIPISGTSNALTWNLKSCQSISVHMIKFSNTLQTDCSVGITDVNYSFKLLNANDTTR